MDFLGQVGGAIWNPWLLGLFLAAGGKDADHPINTLIDKDLRDDKAVKTAIRRIHTGEYVIVKREQTEQVEAQAETDAE